MFDQPYPDTYGPAGVLGPIDCNGQVSVHREPTMLEALENKQAHAQTRLDEINEAITAMKANPALEKALTAIQRSLRY